MYGEHAKLAAMKLAPPKNVISPKEVSMAEAAKVTTEKNKTKEKVTRQIFLLALSRTMSS